MNDFTNFILRHNIARRQILPPAITATGKHVYYTMRNQSYTINPQHGVQTFSRGSLCSPIQGEPGLQARGVEDWRK